MNGPGRWTAVAAAAALAACALKAQSPDGAPLGRSYGAGRRIASLADPLIDESSGLACGRRNVGAFWTHNDSGDATRIFAFGRKGEALATYVIAEAVAIDWEDMASFSLGGRHYLVIADTGDNARVRPRVTLYFIEEPALDLSKRGVAGRAEIVQAITFTFADGPQDCESVAVDAAGRCVYLVSKRGKRTVYELPLPAAASGKPLGNWPPKAQVAKPVATLAIGETTAMDLSPDGLRAVVLTYRDAYEYARRPREPWPTAFRRKPRRISLPRRRQGESICYGPDGWTLYLTSEKAPAPLFEVPAAAGPPG